MEPIVRYGSLSCSISFILSPIKISEDGQEGFSEKTNDQGNRGYAIYYKTNQPAGS